jgi:hypothetical protein
LNKIIIMLITGLFLLVACEPVDEPDVVSPDVTPVYTLFDYCINQTQNRTVESVEYNVTGQYPNSTDIRDYYSVMSIEYYNVTVCAEVLSLPNRNVIPRNRGWECTQEARYIVCDSVRDGNGDGVCDLRGGESCCRFDRLTGAIICKNGETVWTNTRLPVGGVTE